MGGQLTRDLQFFLGQHDLRLLNPEGLWLLLAIPVLFVIGLWMGEDLRWWRKVPIQLLRAMLVAVLAVAYAHPVRIATENHPAVVLLADLSASMDEPARERLEQRLDALWAAREEAPAYLVGFGRRPELLAGPEHRRIDLPAGEGDSATDLAAALHFSFGLYPPRHDRRAVLLSDGEQTRGDLLAAVDRAREFDIELFSVPLLPAATADVRIEDMAAPASTRPGEPVAVSAELVASAPRWVRLSLWRDGRRVAVERIRLAPGRTRIELETELEGRGWHELALRVAAPGDRYRENNRAARRIWVFGRPRVLLVQRSDEPNPLRGVLAEGDWELEAITPAGFPDALAALAERDLVVLDDLELADLAERRVEQLRAYVEEFGGGLLVTTGPDASELAAPETEPIEDLLPVAFEQVEKKEEIPAALVFVTDRSSSMARGGKFAILVRAVVDTLDRLKDTAQVAVVMFDDFPEVVVELTEASQRDTISEILLAQRVGGGTSMYPALKAAHQQLDKSAAKLKHVILLSDGQSISLFGHYGYIVEDMAEDGITVTTVALGEDADQAELERVAGRSGGRFYFTDNIRNVPKIFTAETENITETNAVEQTVRALPAKLVQALAGIDFDSAPPLGGYVASEPRPTAEVLLVSSDRSEPILARWRFGLGRVVVATTDAQGVWSADWPTWSGFSDLWLRLAEDSLRRDPPGRLRVATRALGRRGVISVRVPIERPEAEPDPPWLTVRPPRGPERELELVRRGLGLYRAELELRQLGPYAVRAERRGRRGALEQAFGSVARSYDEEFLGAAGNRGLLAEAARRTGGAMDPEPNAVFAAGRQERERTEDLWPPLLLLALGLFLGEVLIRRL